MGEAKRAAWWRWIEPLAIGMGLGLVVAVLYVATLAGAIWMTSLVQGGCDG